jgi:putative transposase
MKQVTRNLIDPWAGFLRGTRLLIHDRAILFSEQFRQRLRCAQVAGLRLPARSPNLNASAERFVRTIRQECLDRMVFFGETAFRRAVGEFVIPLQSGTKPPSLGNQLIRPGATAFPVGGNIYRRKRLGGLLNYYCREAA